MSGWKRALLASFSRYEWTRVAVSCPHNCRVRDHVRDQVFGFLPAARDAAQECATL